MRSRTSSSGQSAKKRLCDTGPHLSYGRPLPQSGRGENLSGFAHEILLAELDAVMAQQRVSGRHVEEELRDAVRVEIVDAAVELALARSAGTQHDAAAFAAGELAGI